MLVGLNGKWKWPIGYFLLAKSTAVIQAGLITTAIQMAKEAGARVWGGSLVMELPGIDWKVMYITFICLTYVNININYLLIFLKSFIDIFRA